jgi:HNH endonuclease
MKSGDKWSESEVKFLEENYSIIGPSKCAEVLGRTIRGCQLKAKKLKIGYKPIKSYYEKENLEKIVYQSNSYTSCLTKMNLTSRPANYDTLKKYIKKYEIDITHFYSDKLGGFKDYISKVKIPLEEILINGSSYGRTHLKERLYKEGIKKRICEECGQTEIWNGRKISLILDHINGVNNDNRLENLRIVCPNCNASLDTHCRGYKKVKTN